MAWMSAIALSVVSLFQVAHYFFFRSLKSQAEAAGLTPDHVFYQFVEDRQAELGLISFVMTLAVLGVIAIAGLLLSHKIAGPLHRFVRHLENNKSTGKIAPVQFRDGDYFEEIATAYNSTLPSPDPEHPDQQSSPTRRAG